LGFVGILFLALGYVLKLSREGYFMQEQTEEEKEQTATPSTQEGEKKTPQEEKEDEEKALEDILKIEILELDLGYQLIKLADKSQNGDLLERIKSMRRKIADDYGFIMPQVRIRDNLQLNPNEYQILLKGVEIGRGDVYPDKFLAIDNSLATEKVEGIPTKEPAFGIDAIWIEATQKEDNLTQNTEEAPSLEKKVKPKQKKPEVKKKVETPPKEEFKPKKKDTVQSKTETKPVLQEKPKEEPKPVVNTRALFKGSSKNKTGQSQGNTMGGGDQGKPHGYKDSNRYDGQGGKGNGVAFSLGGRGAKYLEKPSAKFTETGTVVVSIWVNPDGKVVRAQVNPKGTTVLDSSLRKIAVDAALNSTFVQDPTAPAQQRGTITYEFVLMK
jgi:TonB family protein